MIKIKKLSSIQGGQKIKRIKAPNEID